MKNTQCRRRRRPDRSYIYNCVRSGISINMAAIIILGIIIMWWYLAEYIN